MIVYFDTVRRKRPVQQGGELIRLDWKTKKVTRSLPIYPTDPIVELDPNPRGNSRGGKGMALSGQALLTCTYHSILFYDYDLNLMKTITHNLFVNLHEISLEGEAIWVSATAIDGAFKISSSGRLLAAWWPREEVLLQRKYNLFPLDIDKTIDNRLLHLHTNPSTQTGHTHLNCVTQAPNTTYVLLSRLGVVCRIKPEFALVLEDPELKGSHSLIITGDGEHAIICGTFQSGILVYNLRTGVLENRVKLLDFNPVKELKKHFPDQPFNKSIFVRGLDLVDEKRVLVGISPASVLEIDIASNELLDMFQYSHDVGDAVHGLVHVQGEK